MDAPLSFHVFPLSTAVNGVAVCNPGLLLLPLFHQLQIKNHRHRISSTNGPSAKSNYTLVIAEADALLAATASGASGGCTDQRRRPAS